MNYDVLIEKHLLLREKKFFSTHLRYLNPVKVFVTIFCRHIKICNKKTIFIFLFFKYYLSFIVDKNCKNL